MKMSRYFRGDFKEKANGEFTASRSLTVSGIDYEAGDTFDKNSVSLRTLRLLYENRKIAAVDSSSDSPISTREGTVERDEGGDKHPSTLEDENDAGEALNSTSEKREAVIVEKGAGWLAVETPDGRKIGKSTRDDQEAAEIKARYEAGEDIAD